MSLDGSMERGFTMDNKDIYNFTNRKIEGVPSLLTSIFPPLVNFVTLVSIVKVLSVPIMVKSSVK